MVTGISKKTYWQLQQGGKEKQQNNRCKEQVKDDIAWCCEHCSALRKSP